MLRAPVFMRVLRDFVRDGEIFIELCIKKESGIAFGLCQ